MKLYFSTRKLAREFAAKVQANKTPSAKVVDGQAKEQSSVNGTRFAVELKVN